MKYKARWATIIIVLAIALFYTFPLSRINLGLDLQGGMHLLLGVETNAAVEAKLDTLTNQLRKELRSKNIKYTYIQQGADNKINIALENAKSVDDVRQVLQQSYPILQEVGLGEEKKIISVGLKPKEVAQIKDYAVEQAAQVIRNRVDELGVSEPLIQRQGEKNIIVQLPGITNPDRAIDLIGKTAQLKFHLVDEDVSQEDIRQGNIPFGDMVLYQKVQNDAGKVVEKIPYVVKKDAMLTGEYLVDAEVRISNQFNQPYVWIKFDSAGSKLFDQITAQNIGERFAIVLDKNVYSAPVIRERIPGGEAQISGDFTMEEATDLAIVLRAGSLPAPVNILENRTVGPSLGKISINKGFKSALIGIILVAVFVLFYYRLSGLVADAALLINFILILGFMNFLGATLTLPGIAGLILIVGMSVDANVLIFERVREELRFGRTPLNALEAGYEKAMSTIMDANITTFIAAIVLFQFGTGPIKGFAVTLSIGILASLFTAIFVTRTVFLTVYAGKSNKSISI
ncbi:protein translocase subunit SecD [Flexistipes sp.]|uniref:protein translocase subunit SecD n=1 Tax=Flexistipes sp. TaxID=3088135 RepID=UPI002E1F7FDE|nr:protein translocase subunit SecD [Flexistipes sp.]